MIIQPATLADFEGLLPIYMQCYPEKSPELAQAQLQALLERRDPSSRAIVAKDEANAIRGVALSGPDPEGYSGAALHLLSVTKDGRGRRKAPDLLGALKLELLASRNRELWIRTEPDQVHTFVRAGAVELGSARPSSGARTRRLLRLMLSHQPDELETERLILRNWRPSDVVRFRALNADEAVYRFLGGPLDAEQSDLLAEKFAVDLARQGFGYWVLEGKEAVGDAAGQFMALVGLASLADLGEVTRRVDGPGLEIAWRLFPAYQNQGFATEAAKRIVEYAARQLHMDELVAVCASINAASERVMQKIGMKRDRLGDFDHPRLPVGHPLRPHLLYRLPLGR